MRIWFLAGLLATPCLAQEPSQEALQEVLQEVLLLRIRPHDAPPAEGIGAGPSAEEVAAARAAREAVWERADRRARLAIASVCTGCLPPAAPKAHSQGRAVTAPPGETPEAETAASPPVVAPATRSALLALPPADSR